MLLVGGRGTYSESWVMISESKCSACTADASVFYCEGGRRGMFLCAEHFRMWRAGQTEDVLEDIAKRHTSRMKRREAKLDANTNS